MKNILLFYKYYLNILSFVCPKCAGKSAINFFQKVRLKNTKRKEQEFYDKANKINIPHSEGVLDVYELGNPKGKLIFLLHGWDSNAGSLRKFIDALIENGTYRIITFDLPAHHKSKEKYTNIFVCKNAFISLLNYVKPQEPFSVISHSFGSAVTVFALSETNYNADKIVFLSANNVIEEVFRFFQRFIGFNETVYKNVKYYANNIIGEPLENLVVSDRLLKSSFNELLLIHDEYDKVIPFKDSVAIHKKIPNSKLIAFQKIGHYRMLWKNEVVLEAISFLEQ